MRNYFSIMKVLLMMLLIALIIPIGLLPSFADQSEDFIYETFGSEVRITGYQGENALVIVPELIAKFQGTARNTIIP